MSRLQHFVTRFLPRAWAADIEAESRQWLVKCPCGYERSIWDLGGIRWKAAGSPKQRIPCPSCGQTTWHVFEKRVSMSPAK